MKSFPKARIGNCPAPCKIRDRHFHLWAYKSKEKLIVHLTPDEFIHQGQLGVFIGSPRDLDKVAA